MPQVDYFFCDVPLRPLGTHYVSRQVLEPTVADDTADRFAHPQVRASVFAEYSPDLHRFLLGCILNPADVTDLMQEIAMAFVAVPRETVIEDPAKYLFGIAKHLVSAFRARANRNPVTYNSDALEHALEAPERCDISAAESEAVSQDLLTRIQRLPRAYRDVLQLNMETSLSYKEIAQQLGMSEDTVKKYLFKAKASLRRDCL